MKVQELLFCVFLNLHHMPGVHTAFFFKVLQTASVRVHLERLGAAAVEQKVMFLSSRSGLAKTVPQETQPSLFSSSPLTA